MTTSDEKFHSTHPNKTSWAPIIAAALLPVVLIGGAQLYIHLRVPKGTDAPTASAAVPAARGDFYLTVKLKSPGGAPIPRRPVVFEHLAGEDLSTSGTITSVLSDTAGVATLSTTRDGTVVIHIDGESRTARVKDLDQGEAFRTVEFVLAPQPH